MRGNTTRVAVVVGVLMLGLQGASGAMYVEDFDAGSGTWNTYAGADYCQWVANGGVGDSGYLQAHRAINYYSGIVPQTGAIGYRDYVADFGEEFRVTYDIKYVSGPNGGMSFNISGGLTTNASAYSYWRKDFYLNGNAPTDWTTISFDVDVNWTKAEAVANGWEETKTGSSSWRQMWEDAAGVRNYSSNFFSQASDRVKAHGNYTGIDNVLIETIPEPATLIVLGAGALGLIRRRR